jgi:cyclopropane fatty-acyl-phospholipid synthase-like methyltransferase
LRELLGNRAHTVLEVGSGTGQHAVYFASKFDLLRWQASDFGDYLPAVAARVAAAKLDNLPPPIELNVDRFADVPDVDVIFSANTLHIMSWQSVCRFFAEAGGRLPASGRMIVYGPFHVGQQATSPSNAQFDASLRSRDPQMGVRDREQVCFQADKAGLSLQRIFTMPANNQVLVFERRSKQGDV